MRFFNWGANAGFYTLLVGSVFSPDGKDHVLTASGDNTARLWDAATGAQLQVLKGHEDAVNTATRG